MVGCPNYAILELFIESIFKFQQFTISRQKTLKLRQSEITSFDSACFSPDIKIHPSPEMSSQFEMFFFVNLGGKCRTRSGFESENIESKGRKPLDLYLSSLHRGITSRISTLSYIYMDNIVRMVFIVINSPQLTTGCTATSGQVIVIAGHSIISKVSRLATFTADVTQTARVGGGSRVVGHQNTLERVSELLVVNGVDNRVETGVRVAKPREDFEPVPRDAGLTEGRDDVDTEEGNPAEEKRPHDNAHCDGRLVVGHVVGGGGGGDMMQGRGGARKGGR